MAEGQGQRKILEHFNTIFLDRKSNTLFIPAYLRLVAKSVQSLDLQSLESQIKLTLILNIFTYGLPDQIAKQISQRMVLQFNRDDILRLDQPDVYQVEDKIFDQISKELDLNTYLKTSIQKFKQQQSTGASINNTSNQPSESPENRSLQVTEPNVGNSSNESTLIRSCQATRATVDKNQGINKSGKKEKAKIPIGFKWTKRIQRKAFVQPYIFFTPFQVVDLVMSIAIRKIQLACNYKLTVRFNIFDTETMTKKISFTESTQFGYYNMATKRLHVQYTKNPTHQTLMSLNKNFYNIKFLDNYRQQVQKDQNQSGEDHNVSSVSNAHFHIPLFKNPVTVVTTLFIPLWLLSSINLAIFSQSPSLGDRIGSIATLMIAFVGLIPITRQQIPPNPTITIFEILVYMQVFTQLLCLWQSMVNRTENQDQIEFFILSYSHLSDKFFLIALLVSLIVFIVPFGMCLYHIFVLKDKHCGPLETVDIDKKFTDWKISPDSLELFTIDKQVEKPSPNLIFLHDKNFLQTIKNNRKIIKEKKNQENKKITQEKTTEENRNIIQEKTTQVNTNQMLSPLKN